MLFASKWHLLRIFSRVISLSAFRIAIECAVGSYSCFVQKIQGQSILLKRDLDLTKTTDDAKVKLRSESLPAIQRSSDQDCFLITNKKLSIWRYGLAVIFMTPTLNVKRRLFSCIGFSVHSAFQNILRFWFIYHGKHRESRNLLPSLSTYSRNVRVFCLCSSHAVQKIIRFLRN